MLVENEAGVEMMNANTQQHLTLKQERLLLECASKKELEEAMNEIEKLCEGHLMYLAKSIDNNNQ